MRRQRASAHKAILLKAYILGKKTREHQLFKEEGKTKVSRYLAVQSERVAKFIMMGTPLGLGVSGERRQEAIDFCARWSPVVQAQRDGTLDLDSLSQNDREFLRHFNVPVMLGWVRAA